MAEQPAPADRPAPARRQMTTAGLMNALKDDKLSEDTFKAEGNVRNFQSLLSVQNDRKEIEAQAAALR